MELAKRLSDPTLFRQQAYVNGAWIDATRGGKVSVSDPATGAVIETVPDMGSNETRAATEAAEASWPTWRAKTGKERAVILRRWFDLMIEHRDDFAAIMTAGQGKRLAEAAGESPSANFLGRARRWVCRPLRNRALSRSTRRP